MLSKKKIRVGVLRGGPSSEFKVSLKTGAAVLAHLPEEYFPIDLFIDRNGAWHQQGRQEAPHQILRGVDVVFNALHGAYGEDGNLQYLLEAYRVPFSGSSRIASAFSFNKALAKSILAREGIQTPKHRVIHQDDTRDIQSFATQLFRVFPQPSIVKPLRGGSSIAVSLAHSAEEIAYALELVFNYFEAALIEEYIEGREVVCGVIEDFRNDALYGLLPVEICLPPGTAFFDQSARENEETRYLSPPRMNEALKQALLQKARRAHSVLGLRHYSSSDFIVHPTRGIFFLETDALPTLAENTPFRAGLSAVGASPADFLRHTVSLAMGRN